MTNIFITDTETTGLDPKTCKLIEIAGILYNVEARTELAQMSCLFPVDENAAEAINGISQASLDAMRNSVLPGIALATFKAMEAECDFIMAHNAPFDKGFIETHLCQTVKPWVCSKSDIKFPRAGSGNRLGYLAVDHGISVTDAHRGLGDCRTLMRLLQQTPDLMEQLTATIGAKTFQALVSFDQKELAKAAGFNWDSYNKMWKRKLTPEAAAALPFQTKELPNG